jgi:hypothetical protein
LRSYRDRCPEACKHAEANYNMPRFDPLDCILLAISLRWEFQASGQALSRTFDDREVAEYYPEIYSRLTWRSRTYEELGEVS